MSLDVKALENPVGASSQDVASSVLTDVAYGAVGGGSGVGVVSIGHLPAKGKFPVPESAPSCFEVWNLVLCWILEEDQNLLLECGRWFGVLSAQVVA